MFGGQRAGEAAGAAADGDADEVEDGAAAVTRTGLEVPITPPSAPSAWTVSQGWGASTRMRVSRPAQGAVVSGAGSALSDAAPSTRQARTSVAPFQLT